MEFSLGKHQKDGLKKLNLTFDDDLIAALEWHMSAAYVKQPNEKTTPLLESRDKLEAVRKTASKFAKQMSSLNADDYYRLSEIIGIHHHDKFSKGASTRRKDIDAIEIVTSIGHAASSLNHDSIEAYGSRANDKPISWLIDFWDENIKKSLQPISEDGEFVRFTAIVLEKDPDAVRKAFSRFLERQSGNSSTDKLSK